MGQSLRATVAAVVVSASFFSFFPSTSAAQQFQMLAAFEQGPRHPHGRLLAVADSLLYGVTEQGGRFGHGTVFVLYRLPGSSWEQATLHSFGGADGSRPARGLTLASNGFLYGITREGGPNDQGTIFRIGLAGGLTTVHSFPARATPGTNLQPDATLIQTSDGNIWGTVCRRPLGGEGNGRIFRMTPAGAVTTVVQFTDFTCARSLVAGADGNVYGTTERNFFRLTTAGVLTLSFQSFTHIPAGDLIVGADGNFYGAASNGVTGIPFPPNLGIVFGFSPSTLDFTAYRSDHDEYPTGIVEGAPGVFYTLRLRGTFVRYDIASGFEPTIVAEIDRSVVGGQRFQLIRGSGGLFYGVSFDGTSPDFSLPPRGKGTVFSVDANGVAVQLHGFDREGPLVLAGALIEVDGALIGASCLGGAYDRGTVYRLDTTGVAILHSFDGGRDFANGVCPTNLVADAAGNVFGMTLTGLIFKVAPDGTFTVLHRQLNASSRQAADSLTLASDGSLWGCWIDVESIVFRLEPNGTFTRFPIPSAFGTAGSSVIEGPDGNFYGAARTATSNVFRLTPAGTFSLVHAFPGPQMVMDRLTVGSDGHLYGSAASFTSQATGFVFQLRLAGGMTNVHQFTIAEGYSPISAVVETPGGELAGVTLGSVSNPAAAPGTVYAIRSTGALRTLHRFNGADGANPYAPLLVGSDGALYGVTLFGGPGGNGVIFRIQP